MPQSKTRFPIRRIFLTSLVSLAIMLIAAWFGGRMYLAASLLETDGTDTLAGLSQPVEVLFDARGIPRIYARTDADALRTLGWLHAAERLFQMELQRKVARGEVAEIVGPVGVESDVLHRQFGFARRIEHNPPEVEPETRALVEAYVAGINARMESSLPPSFRLLGLEPEPWSVNDVLTLAYYQTWYPTTLVQRLAEAWRAAAEIGGTPASDWLEDLPAWGVPSVPAQRMTEASNTWVVAPEKSASGHALHASDPHLDYTMAPGLWYAAGIHSDETLDVLGVTPPGLPFVAMGHNGRIAFAFTVAPVDLYEFYRFDLDPADPDRILGPDGPVEMTVREVEISVRDREQPVRHSIESTPFGIVVERDETGVEVMHWAGFELPVDGLLENGLAINRAGNFERFRAAASDMGALSINWSYSDTEGNIGYVQSTPIPKRRHTRFYTTLAGAEPDNHWAGFVAPDERPFALNPDQGWLANANNHASTDAPWPMPGFYKHLRMHRATHWLESQRRFDATDMRRMQLDRISERALRWKDWLADIARDSGRLPLAEQLRAWDGTMDTDSTVAGLFTLWWQHLPRHLFSDGPLQDWRLGRTLLDDWLAAPGEHPDLAAMPRDAAARAALDDVLRDPLPTLGQVQTLTIAHPLARAGILDSWLDLTRGPMPIGGGPGSLNVTYHRWHERDRRLSAAAGASMRFVMDWADPDAFTLNLTLGQSGHPMSPHFDDFLDDFLDGRPWIVPFARDAVEPRSVGRLRLMDEPD